MLIVDVTKIDLTSNVNTTIIVEIVNKLTIRSNSILINGNAKGCKNVSYLLFITYIC